MKLTCHSHRPTADVFDPRCQRCGRPLLDGNITRDELVVRVAAAFQQEINPTGRQRGTWIEIEEVLDDEVWCWWVRPAANLLGFEAVEHGSDNPTGEELSMAFLVEMLSAPDASATPEIGEAWSRPKPSRWERAVQRYRDWREASETREFVSLAAPLVCVELFAVCWILGSSGCAAVAQALWSLVS